MLEHFSHKELACPDTGMLRLAPGFGDKLESLRMEFDHPMPVNSGCRSHAYNEKIKGNYHSLHVCDIPYWQTEGTCAVDISTVKMTDRQREQLIYLAASSGWSVGLSETFLHLDRRVDYTLLRPTVFLY